MAPGYLALTIATRSEAPSERTELRYLLRVVAFGAFVHVLLSPISIVVLSRYLRERGTDESLADFLYDNFLLLLSWMGGLGVVGPLIVGIGFAWLSNPLNTNVERVLQVLGLGHLDRVGRTHSAWTWIASTDEGLYIRVFLESGDVIGGVWGRDSLMSVDPDYEDIYLEEMWILDDDGDFWEQVPTTRGVWIPRKTIRYIEFLDGREDAGPV